jgi:hypothetical protein
MKNPRTVLALAAFAVTFIFAAGIVRLVYPSMSMTAVPGVLNRHQFDSELALKLEEFIERDKLNGSLNGYGWSNGTISARAAADAFDYFETSSAMDTNGFPEEFKSAWKAHMDAWRECAKFLDDNQGRRLTRSEFSAEMEFYDAEIGRTWFEVIRIARANGAHVTR